MRLAFPHPEGLDALRGDCHSSIETARLDQPVQPPLKAETVRDNKVGSRHIARGGGAWFIDMRVTVRADERHDIHAVSANVADEIAKN